MKTQLNLLGVSLTCVLLAILGLQFIFYYHSIVSCIFGITLIFSIILVIKGNIIGYYFSQTTLFIMALTVPAGFLGPYFYAEVNNDSGGVLKILGILLICLVIEAVLFFMIYSVRLHYGRHS